MNKRTLNSINKNMWLVLIMINSLTYSFSSFGQTNLVPNPSFEIYDTCPHLQNEVIYATGWSNFGNSPDYFNSCSFSPDFSVPSNWGGYQVASGGNAYCALGTYAPCCPNQREFIGAQLVSPLIIGIKYFVSFKVCLSISSEIESYIATNRIGTLFTKSNHSSNLPPPVNNYAHVFSNSIIADTAHWTTIFGSFISDSTYQYISIGNFFDDLNTDTIVFTNSALSFSYYYIDDVCVSTDSLFAATWSSVQEIQTELAEKIYPNPASASVVVSGLGNDEPFDIAIYDVLGREIFAQRNISNKETVIDISRFARGLLIISIKRKNKISNYKILKT